MPTPASTRLLKQVARSVWGVVPDPPRRTKDLQPELIRGSAVAAAPDTLLEQLQLQPVLNPAVVWKTAWDLCSATAQAGAPSHGILSGHRLKCAHPACGRHAVAAGQTGLDEPDGCGPEACRYNSWWAHSLMIGLTPHELCLEWRS